MWTAEYRASSLGEPPLGESSATSESFDAGKISDDFDAKSTELSDKEFPSGGKVLPRQESSSKIVFVRHLKSEANVEGTIGKIRHPSYTHDPDITFCPKQISVCTGGLKKNICEHWNTNNIFVCSPLLRTWETWYVFYKYACTRGNEPTPTIHIANALLEYSNVKKRMKDAFKKLRIGYEPPELDISNQPLPESAATEKFKKWMTDCMHDSNIPNIEKTYNMTTMPELMRALVQDALGTPDTTIFVFGHSNLFHDVFRKKFENGEFIVLEHEKLEKIRGEDDIMRALQQLDDVEKKDKFVCDTDLDNVTARGRSDERKTAERKAKQEAARVYEAMFRSTHDVNEETFETLGLKYVHEDDSVLINDKKYTIAEDPYDSFVLFRDKDNYNNYAKTPDGIIIRLNAPQFRDWVAKQTDTKTKKTTSFDDQYEKFYEEFLVEKVAESNSIKQQIQDLDVNSDDFDKTASDLEKRINNNENAIGFDFDGLTQNLRKKREERQALKETNELVVKKADDYEVEKTEVEKTVRKVEGFLGFGTYYEVEVSLDVPPSKPKWTLKQYTDGRFVLTHSDSSLVEIFKTRMMKKEQEFWRFLDADKENIYFQWLRSRTVLGVPEVRTLFDLLFEDTSEKVREAFKNKKYGGQTVARQIDEEYYRTGCVGGPCPFGKDAYDDYFAERKKHLYDVRIVQPFVRDVANDFEAAWNVA